MTPTAGERADLIALAEAVAADPRDLASACALADWLEERSLATAAGRVRRLVPESADVLVLTYGDPTARDRCIETMQSLQAQLRDLGRETVWVCLPESYDLKLLRLSPPEEATR